MDQVEQELIALKITSCGADQNGEKSQNKSRPTKVCPTNDDDDDVVNFCFHIKILAIKSKATIFSMYINSNTQQSNFIGEFKLHSVLIYIEN